MTPLRNIQATRLYLSLHCASKCFKMAAIFFHKYTKYLKTPRLCDKSLLKWRICVVLVKKDQGLTILTTWGQTICHLSILNLINMFSKWPPKVEMFHELQ